MPRKKGPRYGKAFKMDFSQSLEWLTHRQTQLLNLSHITKYPKWGRRDLSALSCTLFTLLKRRLYDTTLPSPDPLSPRPRLHRTSS